MATPFIVRVRNASVMLTIFAAAVMQTRTWETLLSALCPHGRGGIPCLSRLYRNVYVLLPSSIVQGMHRWSYQWDLAWPSAIVRRAPQRICSSPHRREDSVRAETPRICRTASFHREQKLPWPFPTSCARSSLPLLSLPSPLGRGKSGLSTRGQDYVKMGDIPPNQTLYVQNLNEKLNKVSLKKLLYLAFSAYGRVIDIVACRGESLRGQAWVVFDSVGSATTALRSLQGFPFLGKPMRIQFAKGKSNAVALREGTYEPGSKRRKRGEKDGKKKEESQKLSGSRDEGKRGKEAEAEEHVAGMALATGEVSSMLMAQELPTECTEEMLAVLFRRFAGFHEIRLAGQRGIAFIEFRDEVSARTAFQAYNGFKLSQTDALKLTYAKR